ncbi:TPA: hypothetical protein N0F65_008964 [Lagenidium giganteum]|uniref:Rab-GAP TBC domain-containing protein n=1 Tax=Lagenidium giganteum TaxID=4803 RepID=A0AAV2Z0L3_9STRA|nr:TPA: hypothetical protein N0F65_008964 [Lagenidium giganteum]
MYLRRRYQALLHGEPVIEVVADDQNRVLETSYERWRELQRMVIVYGLPKDEGQAVAAVSSLSSSSSSSSTTEPQTRSPTKQNTEPTDPATAAAATNAVDTTDDTCLLRGRVWKMLLGMAVETVNPAQYIALVARGPSPVDADIRNDTFRTFRGDPAFAKRVPEEKLARLLNVFINELGATSSNTSNSASAGTVQRMHHLANVPDYLRYVQGMNILCAPLLFVMPEADAYYAFCQLIVRHCPRYMAPQLKGVEAGCALVDQCLLYLDSELHAHLSAHGITARIYALPLILSLFACVPPLHELLRVWDVLFAVGVHFVVVLAVAHTVLLREELLEKKVDLMKTLSSRFAPPLQADQLISVALQLLHRLPDELLHEIARHPLEQPDVAACIEFPPDVVVAIIEKMRADREAEEEEAIRSPPVESRRTEQQEAASSENASARTRSLARSASRGPFAILQRLGSREKKSRNKSGSASSTGSGSRPPWKF